jgi:hypothetical protein
VYFTTLRALGSMPPGSTRGGVFDEVGHCTLEIGVNCECEPRLLALAGMLPEIEEFLLKVNSPLANIILDRWSEVEGQLKDQIADTTKSGEKMVY